MADLTCGLTGSTGQEIVERINENTAAVINKVNKTGDTITGDLESESVGAGGSTILSPVDSSAWSGTALADEQALRDFYGDQTITVQGSNFSATSYPDGSVVGSTDNGNFEMRANGRLEIASTAQTYTNTAIINVYGSTSGDSYKRGTDVWITYPIIFGSRPTVSVNVNATYGTANASNVAKDNFFLRLYTKDNSQTVDTNHLAVGTWK